MRCHYGYFPASGQSHGDWAGVTNPQFAWMEGWAGSMQGVVQGGDTSYDDRNSDGTTFQHYNTEDNYPGDNVEGGVGSLLWDIYDSTNETGDNIALGSGPVFDAFGRPVANTASGSVGAYADTIHEVWDNFIASGKTCSQLWQVFNFHGIHKDDQKPTSRVNGLAATQSSTSFQVTWAGSDACSGVKYVIEARKVP